MNMIPSSTMKRVARALLVCGLVGVSSLDHSSQTADGSFWIITDWHLNNWDSANPPRQIPSTSSTLEVCAASTEVLSLRPGHFGGFGCDSQIELFHEALSHMKAVEPNPDFILWLGDNFGHVSGEDTEELVLNSTGILAQLIRETFPRVPVVPTVGNHDTFPYNSDPGPEFYTKTCEFWQDWLEPAALAQCNQTGWLSTSLMGSSLRMLSINSQHQDLGMLDWLEAELKEAVNAEQSVYLITHIPPGPASCYGCSCSNGYQGDCWGSSFMAKFQSLLEKYHSIIRAMFAGHTHSDEFRLFTDRHSGQPLFPLFISNSLPPYNPSTNPAVRLFRFDRTSFELSNWQQFWFDLTSANRHAGIINGSVFWDYYDAKARYSLPDLSVASLKDLVKRFDQDDDLFQAYIQASAVFPAVFDGKCTDEWNPQVYSPQGGGGRCKTGYICPMLNMMDDDYHKCLLARNQSMVDYV